MKGFRAVQEKEQDQEDDTKDPVKDIGGVQSSGWVPEGVHGKGDEDSS